MSDPRPRRTTALALAAVAVLALAGCSDDDEPDRGARPADGASSSGAPSSGTPSGSPGAATVAPSGTPPAGGATDPTAAPQVDLLAAGAAPRRLLELDVAQGHTETSTVRLATRMDLGPLGQVEVPFTVALRTTVTRADDAGVTSASVLGTPQVDVAKLPPGVGPAVADALALVEGTTLRQTFGRNGGASAVDVEVPDGAPDVVARMVDTFTSQGFGTTVPLPEEEVGVGARWRAVSTLRLSGTTSTVTTTYELTALDDTGYTVDVVVRQRTLPGSAAGGGAVVGGSASGGGTITVRSGLLLPAASRASLDGSTVVEVGGQRVRTAFGTTLRLTTR